MVAATKPPAPAKSKSKSAKSSAKSAKSSKSSAKSSAKSAPTTSSRVDPALLAAMWRQDLDRQHGFEPLNIEGRLPLALHGTLYRNGPGQFGQFGRAYGHPFEGDGAVTAVRIADGQAHGAARLHQTAGLREEQAAGKVLYGLSAPWHRRVRNLLAGRDKNTANTNVMSWQGRLFALMEAGKPTEIDPFDLHTIGETDLGVIPPGSFFSAHPHRVASRAASYNFGLAYGRVTKLQLFELPDAGPARHLGAVELAGPPMLHDFIATDTHLIFFVSPVRIDIPRMMLRVGGFEQLFRWRPEHGTEVICVPIDRPAEVVRFTVDAFYQWHFANAFTRGGELVVDYVRYESFDSFHELGTLGTPGTRETRETRGTRETPAAGQVDDRLGRGTFHRATIDLAAKSLRSEQLADRGCEFPTVAPGREGADAGMTYAVFDELTAVGSIDARGAIVAHELPAGECATEPVIAGGHLLSLCHARTSRGMRAFVGVYDRARIPDGPVAKIWLDHHVPITFHGTWIG